MSEKKLTPMEELRATFLRFSDEATKSGSKHAMMWNVAATEVMAMLGKEQSAIEEAYNQGYRDGEIETPDEYTRDISEFNDANQYFNETFKTEE